MLSPLQLELTLLVMAILFGIFSWLKILPSVHSLKEAAEVANTKGGNILLLCLLSLFFFTIGMRFLYWSVDMIVDGKAHVDNAVILTGINWVTGTAFGGAFGALLKTMTGDSGANILGPGQTKTETETKTETKVEGQ